MTICVLAIEQLTGAVAARQALLGGNANASAQAEQKNQSDAVDKTNQDIAAEKAKGDKADSATLDKLNQQLKTQQDQLDKDNVAVKTPQDDYASAQTATQAIQQNFNAAITQASAAASGSGTFSTGSDRANVDKDTVAQIAAATEYIVATVTLKGHLTDTCTNLITAYATEIDPIKQKALQEPYVLCQQAIHAYLTAYISAQGKGEVGLPAVAPAQPIVAPAPPQPAPPVQVVVAPAAPPPEPSGAQEAAAAAVYKAYFGPASAELTPDAANILSQVVGRWRSAPSNSVVVQGFSDAAGTSASALQISEIRAEAVTRYLVARGIPKSQIKTAWFGKARPQVPTADGVPEQRNRRVEIFFE
jgi:outer membrane protein OmpA-like peptidoglycan-associated protein